MSEKPLTYESVLELIRETIRETNRENRESSRRSDREFRKMRRAMRERDTKYEREQEKRRAEWEQRMKETELQMKRTSKEIGKLTTRIGEIVENMVGGRIVDQFQALGYGVMRPVRNHYFSNYKLNITGEIDFVLYNGDTVILIEVKTKLETADVRRHLKRMEEYRLYADASPIIDSSVRYIGAVAGAVVEGDAEQFAHDNGMYVIVQSGEAVEILPTPEGFKAKEW